MGTVDNLLSYDIEKAFETSKSPEELFLKIQQADVDYYISLDLGEYKKRSWNDLTEVERKEYEKDFHKHQLIKSLGE